MIIRVGMGRVVRERKAMDRKRVGIVAETTTSVFFFFI